MANEEPTNRRLPGGLYATLTAVEYEYVCKQTKNAVHDAVRFVESCRPEPEKPKSSVEFSCRMKLCPGDYPEREFPGGYRAKLNVDEFNEALHMITQSLEYGRWVERYLYYEMGKQGMGKTGPLKDEEYGVVADFYVGSFCALQTLGASIVAKIVAKREKDE